MTDERQALIAARDALHRLCLERGSTDGYVETFEKINAALSRVAPSPERDTESVEDELVRWEAIADKQTRRAEAAERDTERPRRFIQARLDALKMEQRTNCRDQRENLLRSILAEFSAGDTVSREYMAGAKVAERHNTERDDARRRPAPADPVELMRMERDAWRAEALVHRETVRSYELTIGRICARMGWLLKPPPEEVTPMPWDPSGVKPRTRQEGIR